MSQDNKATKKDAGEMKTQLETPETNKAGISKEEILKKLEKIFPDADITLTKNLFNQDVIYIRPKTHYKSKLITDYGMRWLIDLANKYLFSFDIVTGGTKNTDAMGDLRVRIDLGASLVSP